jgi:hypothetical protein
MDPTSPAPVIGIDISKDRLDVASLPESVPPLTGCANDAQGHGQLVAALKARVPGLIVLESTGGYQRVLVAALAAAGLPVVVVNPRQVRDFARALGILARSATSPVAWASWPRPIPLTLPFWPVLPTWFNPRRDPSPRGKPRSWPSWSCAAASYWIC